MLLRALLVVFTFILGGCLNWGVEEPSDGDADVDGDGDGDSDIDSDVGGDADSDGEDDECPDFMWTYGFGDLEHDWGEHLAVDESGNVFVTGIFSGSEKFGGDEPVNFGGGTDIFLASFTPEGDHRWAEGFGGRHGDYSGDVAVDSSGNVYLTGCFQDPVTFGGDDLSYVGSRDIVLASFTSDGVHRWSRSFGSEGDDRGLGVAVDGSGNVYFTGFFEYSVNLGGDDLEALRGYDIFLASFTSGGVHRWSRNFGTGSAYGVAVDGSGNVYFTGTCGNTVNFGGDDLGSPGEGHIFLASFTSEGTHRWSQSFGAEGSNQGMSIAVDGSGNIHLTGSFQNAVNFGGVDLRNMGNMDVFLASFTTDGVHRWSRGFGAVNGDYGQDIAVDGTGNVFLTGFFHGTLNFGGDDLTSSEGSEDILLASFTSDGEHRWSHRFGDFSSDRGMGVAVDRSGNVFCTGSFDNTVNFGDTDLASAGGTDIFLLRFAERYVSCLTTAH